MKKLYEKHKIQLKLLLVLFIGLLVLTPTYYYLIPAILNYPEGTYGTIFQTEVEGTNYLSQVFSISLVIFTLFAVTTFTKTRFLIKYAEMFDNPQKFSEKEINMVRNKLFKVPYSLLISNIVIPSISLTFIHALTIHQLGITTLKIFILVLTLITLYDASVFIYTSNLFKKLLIKLPYNDNAQLKHFTIEKRIFFNILPLITVSILFTSILGYSLISIETGNASFETYHNSLYYFKEYNTFSSVDDLMRKTKNIKILGNNDYIFIKTPDNKYINTSGESIEISKFFNKYLNEISPSNDGRVYEYYGIDCQGATINININGQNYTVGIYFYILSLDILKIFTVSFLILLGLNFLILALFAKNLSDDITIISTSFLNITKTKNALKTTPLPLTANDEFSDLIIAFNKIQETTKNHIQQIHDNQEYLMESERLSSLGQLIGGIAHNLKTPIMSISGAAEGLTDLVKEYNESIEDPTVTVQDHHEIAEDMTKWIEKIKEYTEYMSDIITAVKGQAVAMSNEEDITFTVGELVKRVNILMKHELKNAIITLNVDMNVKEDLTVHGDVNNLVQVINNMISNAIQAYNGKTEETIEFSITKQKNKVVFTIEDHAGGLPQKVKEKLFKEMITTKGKNGTGLGLYMSYSTIKAHFNGNITYETEDGKGTKFNIIIPT